MKLFKQSLSDYTTYIIAFLFFGSVYPGLWNRFLIGNTSVLFQLGFLAIWFVVAFFKGTCFSYKNHFGFLLLISFLTSALHCLIHQDNPGGLIFYVEVFIIIGLVNPINQKFMKMILWFNAIMVILSMIGVILAYLGLINPIGTPLQMPNDNAYVDNYLFFFVKRVSGVDEVLFRSCGYYDEPGSFAYVIMLSLIYNKKHLNNRALEIIFLFGGLATLSAAHIFTVLLYLFFFYLKNTGLFQKLFICLCVIGVVWFSNYETDNTVVQWIKIATIDRVENIVIGEDNSRNYSGGSDMLFDHLIIGDSEENLSKFNVTRETFYFFASKFGLFGTILIYVPILFIVIKNIRKGLFCDDMKLIYIFLFNCIQRPDFVFPLYLVMIYYTWYDIPKHQIFRKQLIHGKSSCI